MALKKKIRSRGRPKETTGTLRTVNLVVEASRFEDFKRHCESEGITTSEGIRQLIENEMEEKNQEAHISNSAIGVAVASLVDRDQYSLTSQGYNTLDTFIEKDQNTSTYWHEYYSNVDDKERLNKHEALTLTINRMVKQRKYFLETGKYLA